MHLYLNNLDFLMWGSILFVLAISLLIWFQPNFKERRYIWSQPKPRQKKSSESQPSQSSNEGDDDPKTKRKKFIKNLLIGLGMAAVVIGSGILVYLYLTGGGNWDEANLDEALNNCQKAMRENEGAQYQSRLAQIKKIQLNDKLEKLEQKHPELRLRDRYLDSCSNRIRPLKTTADAKIYETYVKDIRSYRAVCVKLAHLTKSQQASAADLQKAKEALEEILGKGGK